MHGLHFAFMLCCWVGHQGAFLCSYLTLSLLLCAVCSARCSLRLRLCYRDQRCPLCKASNHEVVITRPAADGSVPSFSTLRALPALMSHAKAPRSAGPGAAAAAAAAAIAAPSMAAPAQRGTDASPSKANGHASGTAKAEAPAAADTAGLVLWSKPLWAPGVFVVQAAPGPHTRGPPPAPPLSHSLLRLTSMSCQLCPHKRFHVMRELQGHLSHAHGRQLCSICLKVRSHGSVGWGWGC